MADETRRDPACRPHAHPCSSEWPNRPSCGGFAPRLARRLSCRTTSHAVTMPVGTENARTHCTASRPSLRVVDQTSCIEDRESPPLGPANFRAQATAGGSPNFVGPGRHASGNSSWVGSPFFFFLTRPMPLLERGRLGEQEREEARASVRSSWSVAPSRPVPSLPAPASKQEGEEKANGAGEGSARGGGGGRARRRHLHAGRGSGGSGTGARAHQRRCVSHLPFPPRLPTLRHIPCYPLVSLSIRPDDGSSAFFGGRRMRDGAMPRRPRRAHAS
jgi:hypothetical protein